MFTDRILLSHDYWPPMPSTRHRVRAYHSDVQLHSMCRQAGEQGEAAVFRLHEVQLQLDDARGALDTLQRQQQLQVDAASPRRFQPRMAPQFAGQPGNDEPRPQQLPRQLQQRASRQASAADSTADADALRAARQHISAQGRQLTKQVLLQADCRMCALTHDGACSEMTANLGACNTMASAMLCWGPFSFNHCCKSSAGICYRGRSWSGCRHGSPRRMQQRERPVSRQYMHRAQLLQQERQRSVLARRNSRHRLSWPSSGAGRHSMRICHVA